MSGRFSQLPDTGSNRWKAGEFSSADRLRPPTVYTYTPSDTAARCSRGVGRPEACVQDCPSKISVGATSFLSSCPPTTTSLSPTTAAAAAARACESGGRPFPFPPQKGDNLAG